MLTINFLALRKSELKVERTPYTEVVAVYESLRRKDFDLFMAFYNPVTFFKASGTVWVDLLISEWISFTDLC